jgi:hypothetical protein
LVLLNFDVPQALDALLLAVVVAFVAWSIAVDFIDAECEEGEGEQFEGILGRGAVVDFRKERVL